MLSLLFLFLLVGLSECVGLRCKSDTNPIKNLTVYKSSVRGPGDRRPRVTIVALFPIHGGPDCAEIVRVKNYNGFQRMEAFVWAVDTINKLPDRKVYLETLIYDSCSDTLAQHPIRALLDAQDRVKGEENNMIIGVVGASYSSVTQPFSKATLSLNLPLISYAASRNSLSKFSMFGRTLWSDDVQSQAIYDILDYFDLTSFKVLGTEKDSNSDSIEATIQEEINSENAEERFSTCKIVKFPHLSGSSNECEYKVLDRSIHNTPNINNSDFSLVHFPFSAGRPAIGDDEEEEDEQAESIAEHIYESKVDAFVVAIKAESKIDFLKELQKLKKKGSKARPLQLVATDTWDISDNLAVFKVDEFLQGSITIVPEISDKAEKLFRKHLKSVTSRNNILGSDSNNNPWLREVWRSVSCCPANETLEQCNFSEVDQNFAIDTKVENVINTAILFTEAIEDFYNQCNLDPTCMYSSFKGDEFFQKYIMKVDSTLKLWTSSSAGSDQTLRVRLDCDGNSYPRYAIYQFYKNKFEKIGSWELSDVGGKRLNITPRVPLKRRFLEGKSGTTCNPKCEKEKFRVYDIVTSEDTSHDDCCYTCQELAPNAIHTNKRIKYCQKGSWPNENRTKCRLSEIETSYDTSYPPVWLGIVFNSVCCFLIVGVGVVVFFNRETEIIKKTGLHYIPFMFVGAFLCQLFGLTLFILPSSPFSCLVVEMVGGVGPTFILSAVLVKTYKIHEIFIKTFKKEDSDSILIKNTKLCPQLDTLVMEKLNMKARQILAIVFIIGLQLTVVLGIFVSRCSTKGSINDIYPASRHLQVCSVSALDLFTAQSLNILLLLLCITYAYMARHVPSDFNETKFISFAVFGDFLVLLAGAGVLLSVNNSSGFDQDSKPTEPELEMCVFSFMLSFSSNFLVGMIFTNKLYILTKTDSGPVGAL